MMHTLTSRMVYLSMEFQLRVPPNDIHELYTANTGYVFQLATPYYEELTVRENLTLSALMKLSSSMTLEQKFERVEQVMQVVHT